MNHGAMMRPRNRKCIFISMILPSPHVRGSYLQYSSLAAQFVRAALKPEFKIAAAKRQETTLKLRYWSEGKVTDTRECACRHRCHVLTPRRTPDLHRRAQQALAAHDLRDGCNTTATEHGCGQHDDWEHVGYEAKVAMPHVSFWPRESSMYPSMPHDVPANAVSDSTQSRTLCALPHTPAVLDDPIVVAVERALATVNGENMTQHGNAPIRPPAPRGRPALSMVLRHANRAADIM